MGLKAGSKSGKGGKQNSGKANVGKFQHHNAQNDSGSDDESEFDLSVLRSSIEVNVNGFPDLVKVFNTGSPEVRNILSHECNLIYECKVCQSLFRSLANLISHKRVYCKTSYCASRHTQRSNKLVEDFTVVIQPEPAPTSSHENENWVTSDARSDGDALVGVPVVSITTAVPPISLYTNPKKDLTKIVESLSMKRSLQSVSETVGHISASHFYEDISNKLLARNNDRREHAIQLEGMDNSGCGVFQTKLCTSSTTTTSMIHTDLMKAQISEIHSIESNNEATLGPSGQVVMVNGHSKWNNASDRDNGSSEQTMEMDTVPGQGTAKEEHVCTQCNQRFSTRKTLSHHVKSLHVTFRMCYPCPCCKSVFVNTWSVYRHLYKVHRKTTAQVRKLRAQIQKKAFRMDKTTAKPTSPPPVTTDAAVKSATLKELQRLDQENQAWMDNFEDDLELQRCGGCGRRFERRAALNSHSQICQKRIAARNNIKSHRTPANTSNVATKPSNVLHSECESSEITVENSKKSENIMSPASNKSSNNSFSAQTDSSSSSSSSPYSRVQQNNSGSWNEQTKKDIPEKRIEIQIRRDYCKMSSAGSGVAFMSDAQSESDSRPQSCIAGDESIRDWEADIQPSDNEYAYSQLESNNEDLLQKCLKGEEITIYNDVVEHCNDVKIVDKLENCDELSKCVGSVCSFHNKCVEKMNDSAQSTVIDREKTTSLSLEGFVTSTTKQGREYNKRKRPSSAVVRQPREEVADNDKVLTSESNEKPPKVSKRMEQFSPVMESRMQEMINIRRLQCLTCQKKFNKLTNLRRHVAMHIGWCRYRCIMCPYKCFSKYDCVAHICKVHLKSGLRSKAVTMVQYIEAQVEESEATMRSRKQFGYTSKPVLTESEKIQKKLTEVEINSVKSKVLTETPLSIINSADSLVVETESSGCIVEEYSAISDDRSTKIVNKSDETDTAEYLLPAHSTGNTIEDNADDGLQMCFDKNKEEDVITSIPSEMPSTSKEVMVQETQEELNNDIKLRPMEELNNGELKEDGEEKNTSGERLESDDGFSLIDGTYPLQNDVDLSSGQEQDPSALQKMVMEVIFGSGNDLNSDQTPFTSSNIGVSCEDLSSRASSGALELEALLERNCDSPTSDPMSPLPSELLSRNSNTASNSSPKSDATQANPVEGERRERPVRNRVKVAKKDFIYDLSDASLNPKKDSDGHTKTPNKRKQCDSMKELLKPGGLENTSVANNFEVLKCVPKLMLVRTDLGENSGSKRITLGAKGTWSSSYSPQASECNNEKGVIVNTPQISPSYNISTRKSQRVFDTKPLNTVDTGNKEKHLL